MKTVDNILLKTGMGDLVNNKGTLTEDDKYVASVFARFTGEKDYKQSQRNANVKSKVVLRLDAAIYEYDNGKQGDAVVEYLSMRVMDIVSTARGQSLLLVGLDNDSNRQYKNIVVGNKFWQALKEDVSRAISAASTAEISGEQIVTVSNVHLVNDAETFIEAAHKAEERRASVQQKLPESSNIEATNNASQKLKALASGGSDPEGPDEPQNE